MVNAQVAKHRISSIYCSDGSITTDISKITSEILRFYESLLGVADPIACDVTWMCDLLPQRLDANLADSLVAEVTNEEILQVLKRMPTNKAPGPDGYTAEFFVAAWQVVGNLVCAAIKEFFVSGKLLK